MPQNTINQRLKFLLDFYKISARTLSRELGVADTNTQNYVGPKQAEPGAIYLEKLLHHFPEVDAHWLLTGDNEPFVEVEGEASDLPSSRTLYQRQEKNKGNVAGINHGNMTQQRSPEGTKSELEWANQTIARLESQLRDKQTIIDLLQKSPPS